MMKIFFVELKFKEIALSSHLRKAYKVTKHEVLRFIL